MARRRRRRRQPNTATPKAKVYVVYPVHLRLRVVKAVLDDGLGQCEVAKAFGLSYQTVRDWVLRFRVDGVDGLVPKPAGKPPKRKTLEGDPRREAIVAAKHAEPQAGTRRVRDELARREGLGVSETTVRRVLLSRGARTDRSGAADLIRDAAPRGTALA